MPPPPLSLRSSPSVSISPSSSYPCSASPGILANRHNNNNQVKQANNTPLQVTVIKKQQNRNGVRGGKCKAGLELSVDTTEAVAIGACILNSVVFPLPPPAGDSEAEESLIDSADARFAVMGIISFIPYFNWMSWVFAWMDTGRQRYAVYALVYLAPYLRKNLSISPEDSWLPIASILLCIFHIQLEASIKNGDVQGFQVFNEIANRFTSSSLKKKKKSFEEDDETHDFKNLPSGNDDFRDKIRGWSSRKRQHDILNEDDEDN